MPKLASSWGVPLGHETRKRQRICGFPCLSEYRQRAVCFTDFYQVYASVLPSKRHKAVDKASDKTSLIERLNNTIRQRCSRLVRKVVI